MRPRSIAVVLHDLPLGGTERIALRLARAWEQAGVRVHLLCGDPRGPLRPLVPAGAALVALDPPVRRAAGSRLRLGRAAAAWLARNPVDALFVPGNFHWDAIPPLAALPAAVRPVILAQISSPIAMPRRGRLAQWRFERRMRRTLAGADRVVAMDGEGQVLAGAVLARAIDALPLPAIDDEAPPPLPLPDDGHVVAAGRLIRQKGFDLLIRAIATLPFATLTIVGEGPERGALERLVARLRVGDRVRIVGFAPDIRPVLDRARLFVLPSRFEGYGAVIVEALAAGRPVVATRTTPALGDLPAVIGIAPDDVPALAHAIAAAIAAPADPATLAASVARYRLGTVAAAYLDLMARP